MAPLPVQQQELQHQDLPVIRLVFLVSLQQVKNVHRNEQHSTCKPESMLVVNELENCNARASGRQVTSVSLTPGPLPQIVQWNSLHILVKFCLQSRKHPIQRIHPYLWLSLLFQF